MKSIFTPLVVCALATLVAPRVVCAQTPAAPPSSSTDPASEAVRRPFRGIFGAPADPTSKQSLDVSLSGFGAYSTDVFGSQRSQPSPRAYQQPGWYTGATAGVSYARHADSVSFGLDADAAANRYPRNSQLTTSFRAGGNMSARIGSRTHAAVEAGVSYAPQYRLGLFSNPDSPTGTADPFQTVAPDFDLFKLTAYRSSAEATLSQDIGRRASLSGFYSIAIVDYTSDQPDYRSYATGIHFSNRLTQHLGYHLGYSTSTASYSVIRTVAPRRINNIDAGVDYGRALSFSRRTTLSFSTGSALVDANPSLTTSDTSSLRYRLTGNAELRHEIGRSWGASLGYVRSVNWREGFAEPFLSDGVNATLGGFVTRRLRFSSGADYAFGSVGFGGSNNGYSSGSAYGSLEMALSHIIAMYGRYVYYRYNFESGVTLDPRLVSALDRQGVNVGIQASFPILR